MEGQANGARDLRVHGGQVHALEATPGTARAALLTERLQQAQAAGAQTWLLNGDHARGGPWAGLRDMLAELVPQIEAAAPELLRKHDYELVFVLPMLRPVLGVRNPSLTDTAKHEERVRNFPADRAFRIVHGLIDLFASWHQRTPETPWVIACDSYDRAGPMVQRFFAELLRRRGESLKLTLIVATDHGASAELLSRFDPPVVGQTVHSFAAAEPASAEAPAELARQAQALTEQIGDDDPAFEHHAPELIWRWLHSDQPAQAIDPLLRILTEYTTLGLYEDVVLYGQLTLALLKQHRPQDSASRWYALFKMHQAHIGLKQAEPALEAISQIVAETNDPNYLFRCYYMIAMLHTRYLPQRDFAKAEAYLDRGVEEIAKTSLPEHTKVFQHVFNRNGLALIRHFAGDPEDAIRLCRWGHQHLDQYLLPDQHRLHRSVLLYNIAQVYSSTRQHDDAIGYFTMAMELDPNYSEYYNERGNMYLHLERLDEALDDYLRAIELSPPYAEVWTNIGQCYRLLGQFEPAIAAYDRALDLDPTLAVPLAGRAEAFEALGRNEDALRDYSAALTIKPNQPIALSNRAILHYTAGRVEESYADLSRAIELAPTMAELYQNRAVALFDLDRPAEAVSDLQAYLRLNPEAEDRLDVQEQIEAAQSGLLAV
jgi:tetratricopeptide (TPR) repeat protein